jgi:hypothetical protein
VRRRGYAVSQRISNRVEEIFGWSKTVAGIRKARYRGRRLVGFANDQADDDDRVSRGATELQPLRGDSLLRKEKMTSLTEPQRFSSYFQQIASVTWSLSLVPERRLSRQVLLFGNVWDFSTTLVPRTRSM